MSGPFVPGKRGPGRYALGMEAKKRKALSTLLALSLLYGGAVSWLYLKSRRELAVYQRGALSLIAQKVEETDAAGQLERMERLGLLDALNDPEQGRGGSR